MHIWPAFLVAALVGGVATLFFVLAALHIPEWTPEVVKRRTDADHQGH